MSATPRPHYEEIDWLDYVQGAADRSLKEEMHRHLAGCAACRLRLDSMKRTAEALEVAGNLVSSEEVPAGDWTESMIRKASAVALSIAPAAEIDRAELLRAFSRPAGGRFPWTPASFELARALCRELLRSDVPLAGRIARSALSALESAPNRNEASSGDLEGVFRTVLAYVVHSEGDSARALEELDRARPILETSSRVPEDELVTWNYVRALALRDLGRADAALEALDLAENLAGLLEDFPRRARCRIARAVTLSDLGKPEEAIAIYEELLARGERALDDPRLVGMIELNLGSDLIRVNRTKEAKRAYAKAAEILRRTGEESRLFRIRAGLAEIALREGRFQDCYDIGVELRSSFRSQDLGWDEVRTELRIANALLRLGRNAEAAETCKRLQPRIRELGLSVEAARAIEYLTEAELSLERVEKVRQFLDRVERGEDLRWSAA